MKALIIKLGALGDIVFSTPIIKRIQDHHKDDQLTLLTTPSFEHFFDGWPNLQIKSFPRGGIIDTIKTVCWLRKQGFKRVYDLQSNDRTSILCALSGIPIRIGNHPRFPYNSHPNHKFAGECHAFDRLNQIIESVGIMPAEPIPFLPISDTVVEKVETWIRDNSLQNKPFVLLHAGSSRSHLNKRWPYYRDLGKKISEMGFKIIWIGSNDDEELNASLSQTCGINATNRFSMNELIQLGNNASFAVTNDSAPMHLLSCSNIPVFSIFGPTNPRRTHALGQAHRVITLTNIMPKDDQSFQPQSIDKIELDSVLERIQAEGLLKITG